MSKKRVKNLPLRITVIVILTIGGFIFPLLFLFAGFIAWTIIDEIRNIGYRRREHGLSPALRDL